VRLACIYCMHPFHTTSKPAVSPAKPARQCQCNGCCLDIFNVVRHGQAGDGLGLEQASVLRLRACIEAMLGVCYSSSTVTATNLQQHDLPLATSLQIQRQLVA
jgi:hypothetical protein